MAQPLTVCRLMVWSGFIDAFALRAPSELARADYILGERLLTETNSALGDSVH